MASLPFKVKASYEYNSPHDDDLSFPQGQIITVTEEEDADWYVGEYSDESGTLQSGLFPRNFVERYEPAPPPRPVRSTRAKSSQPPPEPVEQPDARPQEPLPAQQQAPPPAPSAAPVASPAQLSSPVDATAPQLPVAQPPAPKPASAKAPPPVAEKSASFKDRIAAFNKASGPPVTPFKPGALASGGFVKKPFIAPPPSRSAYVPLPPESARKVVYRREEDPEIAERQAQDREIAEKAGLVPSASADGEEEAPKAVSLKERIALLQKQQLEQASRRAEISAKEKPRKPMKKRSESEQDATDEREPHDLGIRMSSEQDREQQDHPRRTPRIPQGSEVQASDGNDADQSAADETAEEAEGASTGEEEQSHDRVPAPAEAEEEDEEEDELDEDARHQLALRERMAKLSGGMGMGGMFGPPGAMPMPGMRSNSMKKKAPERSTVDDDDTASPPPPPRAPTVPVPGVNRTLSHPPDGDPRVPKGKPISISPVRRRPVGSTRQYSGYNRRSLPDPAPRPYESKDFAIRWILCSLH
jgi:myosin tail region-interacting protein MTI1